MTQPFDTPSDALEHFGVKGMRWGVRKELAKAKIRGAALRKTDNALARTKAIQRGKGMAATMPRFQRKVGETVYGKARYRKKLRVRISKLEEQKDRIELGKESAKELRRYLSLSRWDVIYAEPYFPEIN